MVQKNFNNALVALAVVTTGLSFVFPRMLDFALFPLPLFDGDFAGLAASVFLFQFLHGGFFHLLGNGFFLLYFGTGLEMTMGLRRYATFFLFSTILVAASVFFLSSSPTVGISGFAMAVLAHFGLTMKSRGNPEYKSVFFFLFLNVAFGLFSNVSLIGHASGAIAGAIFWYSERI